LGSTGAPTRKRGASGGNWAGAGASAGGVTDYVALRRTSNLSINNAPIDVNFNAEDADLSDYWVVGSPNRLTVPAGKAGDHLMTLTWAFDGGTDRSFGDFQVYDSGNNALRTYRSPGGFNGEDTGHNTIMTRLNDGDYIKVVVYQPRSGNLTSASFEMARIA